MKKTLSAILITFLLFSAINVMNVGVTTKAQNLNGVYNGLLYTIHNDKVTIVGYENNLESNLKIPKEIEGVPVIAIGAEAFSWNEELISITLPDTITNIGDSAFYWCKSLKDVELGKGIIDIGEDAFYYCDSLINIKIPDSVSRIGASAFSMCDNLKNVYISDLTAWCKINFEQYDSNPFYYADNLYLGNNLVTNLIIPNDITNISTAFRGCCSITSVTLPAGVTSIENNAFSNCVNLQSINLPNTITSIGEYSFYYCSKLTDINIPNGVIKIGREAFRSCNSLTEITIPESVTSIGFRSFYNCSYLESVYLGNGVTNIESGAFGGCSSLTNITLPEGIEKISPWMFEGCRSLSELYLPKSITKIGEYSFYGCDRLVSINIPIGVASIETNAFNGCQNLSNISIPKNTLNIADYAFNNCTSLKDIWYEGDKSDKANIKIGILNFEFTDANWHYNTCKEHTFSNKCDKICNKCDFTRTTSSHIYCDASCTQPKKCKECGATSGKALGHNYTNSCDKSCNRCKATRSIKHTYSNACDTSCNVCKATRSITHAYKTATTKATLENNGKIVKECTECDKITTSTIKKIKSVKLSTTTFTYNGKAKKPSVTVKDSNGKKLTEDKDYTVTYPSGRKKVGNYKVKIKFKGNYSGEEYLTFKINPKATKVSSVSAGKKSLKIKITKQSSQTTGYEVQYSTSKKFSSAKTKKVTSYKTTSVTLKSLKAKKTYYVRVRTYKTVNGKKYYSAWSSYKSKKTK